MGDGVPNLASSEVILTTVMEYTSNELSPHNPSIKSLIMRRRQESLLSPMCIVGVWGGYRGVLRYVGFAVPG